PDLLLVHVGEQEVLGLDVLRRGAGVDAGEVVGERADVVVMVLRPARHVGARQLAARPGDAEGGLGGGLALDGVLEGGTEFVWVHKRVRHRRAPVSAHYGSGRVGSGRVGSGRVAISRHYVYNILTEARLQAIFR